MEVNTTISTVASIFLLLLAGYGAKRFGALKSSDATVVNALVINLTMPAFIFVYTHQKPLTMPMIKAPALGFAVEIVFMGLAYLVARAFRLDRRTTGALMLVTAFGNTGFLGYPVVNAAFNGDGHAMLTAVLFDGFGMSLAINTVGVAAASCFAGSKFEWRSLLEFLKTPLFPMTVIALIFRTAYVPPIIMKTLSLLAAGTVPLAMISIGLNLSAGPMTRYPGPLAVAVVLKMAILPLLMFHLLPLIGVTGTVGKVVVLESAMPCAVFTGVVAGRYGANGAFAASAVFVMTLVSVVWIPGVLMLLR